MKLEYLTGVGSGDLLRFLTCGSVDDGKSTLLGRLLYETQQIPEDQFSALKNDSKRFGTTGNDVDLALLVDGLEAEREQGITIDVSYRFFRTPRRSFVAADTPGHEQYTRNMATGASTSELAIILVDARKGILTQTRRHSIICSLLGIRHVVLAINKFDLVGYSQSVFNEIVATYSSFSAELGFSNIVPIPVSARHGDNVSELSLKTEWYSGPTLLGHLETAELQIEAERQPFRMPVQWVNRPDLNLRGYCGTIAAGQVKVGDEIIVVPSRLSTVVSRIITPQGEADVAARGEAVTVILERDIDISRGDLLGSATHPPEVADQFAADLVALGESDLLPGRSYLMRIGTKWISASITAIKYRLDVNTGQHLAATALHLNEIGRCNIAITHPVGFDPYACNRTTGAFILVDRATNETIAAGMIMFGLRRSQNLVQTDLAVSQEQRAAVKQQRPVILWLTGLPGSGKSTIAKIIERRLYEAGRHTYMLDGDNIRHGLNRDLGFSEADRVENIRRAGEVAKLFLDAGLIVICSFISPFRAERDSIRSLVAPGEFVEIFVDTPLEECIRRDPKGLYGKAHAGLIKNFTGLDSPYEAPTGPELKLDTLGNDAETLAAKVVDYLAAGKL